ncbi:type II restriction endonuclease [Vibrio rotiferianus]|uniref:type II restriction endonuclease n=2 Tax=Vibrio rotiferianus TaxID=190895 RepID=UPI0003A5EFA4|nr:type II restriction endonuclease [Vibrio rotiferianus]
MSAVKQWLTSKETNSWVLYIKRLSANDTGASGAHQVGIYIPKDNMVDLFPSINRTGEKNPDHYLTAITSSHDFPERQVRAIYYNNKFFDGTRNEMRVTQWGGRHSPLQDHENTGALCVLAFHKEHNHDSDLVDIWVCRNPDEEEELEELLGEVLPGQSIFSPAKQILSGLVTRYDWKSVDYPIPEAWHDRFPSGAELIEYLSKMITFNEENPDNALMQRREAEYSLFRRVEEIHVLDLIKTGFSSVDEFISLANSVSNRRKSRSGKSLELHLEHIFLENSLSSFDTQAVTENNKKPDFLFPSGESYHDANYPVEKLRMLAVKTTCKDRWRQVLNEADRIQMVYLFTLQEGVSKNQFKEMTDSNVKLVVPLSLHKSFHKDFRDELISLESFIESTKEVYID